MADPSPSSPIQYAQEPSNKRRRTADKYSLNTDALNLENRIQSEIAELKEDRTHKVGIRFLQSIGKSLRRLRKDVKLATRPRPLYRGRAPNGFLGPVKISTELAAFTGWDPTGTYNRLQVNKFVYDYIKENRLYEPSDHRIILPDDKLKSILRWCPTGTSNSFYHAPTDLSRLTYFWHLHRVIKHNFTKA